MIFPRAIGGNFRLGFFREKLALHQGASDENGRRFLRIHVPIRHASLAHLEAVQGRALGGHDSPGSSVPVWVFISHLAQVGRELDDPKRVDARHGARKHLRGLHYLARDNPLGLLTQFGFGRLVRRTRGFAFLSRLGSKVKGGARETRSRARFPAAR